MKVFCKDRQVNIVCFGDSNTKYYLGDLQQDGPEGESYPAKLQELFWEHDFQNVRVWNCDMGASVYGVEIKGTKKRDLNLIL